VDTIKVNIFGRGDVGWIQPAQCMVQYCFNNAETSVSVSRNTDKSW